MNMSEGFTNDSLSTEVPLYTSTEYYGDEDDPLIFLCDDDASSDNTTLTSVVFSLVFVLSLTGNVLVLCVLAKYEDMKKVTNIFILNLAISDLVFASSLPFWAVYHSYHWIFGSFMCKLISGVYFIGVYSSLIFLTVMSVDRYLTVVHSVSIALRKRTLCAWSSSAVIWTIAIAASIKEMVNSDTVLTQDKDIFICEEVQTGITPDLVGYCLQIVFLFLLPFFIIVFCYCSILKTVITCKARAKYNAVKIIFGIVVAFFICWAPYNLVMFLMSLNDLNPSGDCDRRAKLNLAFNVCRNLAYFHCCLNPLLYVCTAKYRAHLRRLVCNSAQQTRERSSVPVRSYHNTSNIFQNGEAAREEIDKL
ncbi:chemokine XC receptor 1-like [Lepisosteus oculatus]|uniref:chemokine XC receptor 1-like n=1 Tax=Lepisosteus oculatus TaxID=7918 RepID=UPI00371AE51B